MSEQSATALPEITLREMTAADLPACHGLSQAVSWSHRLEDWQLAFHCGKGWVAESAGQVLGSAIYWPWGNDSSTLGLVIVSPDCQGRGVGKALLKTLIGKLDGVAKFGCTRRRKVSHCMKNSALSRLALFASSKAAYCR